MPDLTDLLDRTTPRDVRPLDVESIGRTAGRRRRRNRIAAAAACVAIVGVVVGVAALPGGDAEPEVSVIVPGVDGRPMTEPVGEWRAGAAPPFGPRGSAFAGALSDGRVVVWGGDSGAQGAVTRFDGGVYDVEADSWDTIDAAPLPPGLLVNWMQLAGDRLAVLGHDDGTGRLHGAVYDVATRSWTALPVQNDVLVNIDAMAWDGETLAIVRYSRGAPELGGDFDLDWRITEPTTLRWRFGEDAWSDGARPPFGFRFGAAIAFDGNRLAVVGGTAGADDGQSESLPPGPDPNVVDDGFIYDLAADAWTAVPTMPTGGTIWANAAWTDGTLVVGGGTDRLSGPTGEAATLAAFDPGTGTWTELEATAGGVGVTTVWTRQVDGDRPIVLGAAVNHSGSHPRPFYGPGGWENAPLGDLRHVGDFVVATSVPFGNPGGDPFELYVRGARDVWLRAAEAPFTNRMEPAVATTGNRLVIVGGYEGPNLTEVGDAWVFDLASGDDP